MELLRKEPKKARSRELVDAILEAATRVLPGREAERTTTNEIAEVAGVSIGSLYQYFPNKDAILARLIERDMEQKQSVYMKLLDEMRGCPLPEIVDAIVSKSTEMYLANPRLIKALFVHAPRLKRVQTVLQTRDTVGKAFAQLMRERPEEIRVSDPEQAIFVLINAIMGVYQTWVLVEPENRLNRDDLNRHLSRLIMGYLQFDPTRA